MFGRVETFPRPYFPILEYFTSIFMNEITTSTREKLRVETDLSIMRPLWEFWHNQLIGSKCIFPNEEYSLRIFPGCNFRRGSKKGAFLREAFR
jgi:hypothetical protein